MTSDERENKKQYHRAKDRSVIKIRINTKERIVLDDQMKKDEWENVSGFIKYKLFGDDLDTAYKKIVKEASPEDLVSLCRKELRDLNVFLIYIRFRYEKDMKQLYREEGVDIKKWIKATEKWHQNSVALLKDVYTSFREIANHLGIDISHESLAPNEEEHDYSDTQANDETARKIYEQYQINETRNLL